MCAAKELYHCNGVNGSITLYRDKMDINSNSWGFSNSYQLPIERISAVVVERKSVMPFATLAVLAAIITVLTRFNALWFLVDLGPQRAIILSSSALAFAAICAIPALVRVFFVSVSVTWDGNPTVFRVGFVIGRRGKRLAKRFQELSM